MLWSTTKKYFDAWEDQTARYLEEVMKSPLVLEPAGALVTTAMKLKGATDRLTAGAWGLLGLPTKRDQERTLHALHQIQSRLADLEEKLADSKKA
jgi:hypothetical protein